MPRARELGIRIGTLEPGPGDAITDVAGVRVGHSTIVHGRGKLRVGKGPARTGVVRGVGMFDKKGGDAETMPLLVELDPTDFTRSRFEGEIFPSDRHVGFGEDATRNGDAIVQNALLRDDGLTVVARKRISQDLK